MHTRCPSCQTVFRLSEAEVSLASGTVQCSVCQHLFDALENQEPEKKQQETMHTNTLAGPDYNLIVDDSSASLMQPHLYVRPRFTWWNTLIWVLLILTALVTVLGQLIWFNSKELARQTDYKPYIEPLCQHFGCQLPSKIDLNRIELLSGDVRSHPTYKNALLITATFINRAQFDQPYPNVALTLSDLSGNIVAQRNFKPEEYQKENYHAGQLMAREVPITMVMQARDPEKNSVSFRFDFL